MKVKKYILPVVNILISVLGIISLFVFKMSEYVVYKTKKEKEEK